MIRYVDGDILDDPADVLVLPCNMMPGVLGKGLALSFKQRWPQLVEDHRRLVKLGKLAIGRPASAIIDDPRPDGSWIEVCFFPTKDHWKNPSRLEWIHRGMVKFVHDTKNGPRGNAIKSIAMPALGCGLGGLPWNQVKPLLELAELQTDDVSWTIYLPKEAK